MAERWKIGRITVKEEGPNLLSLSAPYWSFWSPKSTYVKALVELQKKYVVLFSAKFTGLWSIFWIVGVEPK